MRIFLTVFPMLALTACLEPQPKPDLQEVPISEFNIQIVGDGFKNAWSVSQVGKWEYLVTEKGGELYYLVIPTPTGGELKVPRPIVHGNKKQFVKVKFKNLPTDIYTEGQAGLFDVVISPDFVDSKKIYLSYAYGTAKSNGTALISAKLTGDTLTEIKTLFRTSPPKAAASHFGGRIIFLPDDTLVLTLGDGFTYREEAQNLNSHLGKIVRLTRDGSTPGDNPKLEGKPQIYSYGHRNVQGLAYDTESGEIWEHEHGPRGGDELNLIKPGQNYGWPIATTGLDYNGAKITPFKKYDGMIDPIHDWVPSIAPSGLAIYRGDLFPDWNGDALIGGLVSRDIRVVNLEGGESKGEISILSDLDDRVRDVRVASDGAILVLTDDPENGKLLRITPKK